jgi:hypothetical protein
MFNALGRIMGLPNALGQGSIERRRPSDQLVTEFITQFNEQEKFIAYFREHWQKKSGKLSGRIFFIIQNFDHQTLYM